MAAEESIDLGWTKIIPERYSAVVGDASCADSTAAGEVQFGQFLHDYEAFGRTLSNVDFVGRYSLSTDAYISDIEDALRQGLLLFDRTVIEVSHPGSRWNVEQRVSEGGVDASYRFFSVEILHSLSDHFGDVLACDELAIIPSFSVDWEEADEYTAGSNRYDVEFFMGPLSRAWTALGSAERLSISWDDLGEAQAPLNIPALRGGKIADLVRLRQDEKEAFLRWRRYLNAM